MLAAIWLHFLGDFVFQTNAMAQGKSKSNGWLAYHVGVYTACLLPLGWRVALLNGLTHFVIDWFSARMTSRLWKAGKTHEFFVVIGADQAVHMTILLLTLN